ncbi:MAG: RHO alpha subunit C-terminal catalytic domain-containing protein [Ilumatobacteraceae bacterium]
MPRRASSRFRRDGLPAGSDEFHLPELPVGRWGGFVFINPTRTRRCSRTGIAELAEHFSIWKFEDRYVEVHVAKVIAANWKVTQEAFCEAYHVAGTHPQVMPYLADAITQVDCWGNISRAITPAGLPSPLLAWDPTEEDMFRAMFDIREGEDLPVQIEPGETMRSAGARMVRERWRPIVGDEIDQMSDAEAMDSIDYTIFPNFHPWGAFNRIAYRFRPNGDDHRSSIMEVMYLAPFSGERPPPAEVQHLGVDDSWTEAPQLGTLAKVFEQDTFNMAKVQRGLETTYKPGVTLGDYQESKIRWIHQLLDEWIGDDE